MHEHRRHTLAYAAKAATLAGVIAVFAPIADAAAQTKITLGRTTGASGFHLPSYIAVDKGLFKKEGLDARFISMTGKALVTAGMGGNINFVPIPGGGSQAQLQGAPLIYVVGQSLVSQWAIVTPQSVKSVEELKGKTFGYGRAGSADHDEGVMVLQQNFNMLPGKDYKVITFQGEPERVAALINGDIQAGLMSFPHAAKAQVAGFKILIRTGDYLPRLGGAFWTTRNYLEKNPETVKKFIRSIANATEYLKANKEGSIEVIQKYFGIKDPKEAEAIWTTVKDLFGPDLPSNLMMDLFNGRVTQMKSQKLIPADLKFTVADSEKFIARDILTSTLREMGYYLQAPSGTKGKMN